MKRLFVLIILIAIANASLAKILDKTDRFTGIRTLSTAFLIPLNNLSKPNAYVYIENNHITNASIHLITIHENWKYLTCNQTYWLIDDKPFVMPQPTHSGQVLSGGVSETLAISHLSVQTLEKIGSASKVEYKICNDEFAFTPAEIADFRELAKQAKAIEAQ